MNVDKGSPVRLENIGDDLMLSVFSFVATTPEIENVCDSEAPILTDVLPKVSKRWNELSGHNFLWRPLVLQRLENESELWTEGLRKLIRAKNWDTKPLENESNNILIEKALEAIGKVSYKSLYRQVVSSHIRFTGPVFYMPGHVLLGESYRLHMFEPRYRLLVAELMKYYPDEARTGGEMVPGPNHAPPIFIHANREPDSSTPACLVQIVRCNISSRDGTADVTLLPVSYVWLEKLWVRPDSYNLHYAQCLRMGSKASREMHEVVNRETLDSVMSRIADFDYVDTTDEEFELDEMGDVELG